MAELGHFRQKKTGEKDKNQLGKLVKGRSKNKRTISCKIKVYSRENEKKSVPTAPSENSGKKLEGESRVGQ